MIVLAAGLFIALVTMRILGGRVQDIARRRLVLGLATAAALMGWVTLAYMVSGTTYQGAAISLDGSGDMVQREYTQSLVDMGIAPLTAVVLVAEAVSFGTLLLGAAGHAAHWRSGIWLMAGSLVAPVTIAFVSFGLAALIPAVVLAFAAAVLAFSRGRERRRPPGLPGAGPWSG